MRGFAQIPVVPDATPVSLHSAPLRRSQFAWRPTPSTLSRPQRSTLGTDLSARKRSSAEGVAATVEAQKQATAKSTDPRFVEYWDRLVEGMHKAGLPKK
jgi:hypothetical protein